MRIGIIYIPNDRFLHNKVLWLSQYGDVEIVIHRPEIDYDKYFELIVIDAVEQYHTDLTSILLDEKFFDKYLKDTRDVKLLAMNVAGLSLFELLGGKTEQTLQYKSRNPLRPRRNGLMTKVAPGKSYTYTMMPIHTTNSMIMESMTMGQFISYTTPYPKRKALKVGFKSCTHGQVFFTESIGIIVGMPYMLMNREISYNKKELNLDYGGMPSDYVLRRLLKLPRDGQFTDPNPTVTVPS